MRPFSYEVPPGGADRAGLEGFLVYPAGADEPAGKVGVLLERGDARRVVDRTITFLPLLAGALTTFALFATLALYAHSRDGWVVAFLVIPVALAAATGAALFSAARRPYAQR